MDTPFAPPKPLPIPPPPPPKNMLNRSSGLMSPWKPPALWKPGWLNPDDRLGIPPPRWVGSALGFESNAARRFVSDSTWKALDTTARELHPRRGSGSLLLKASSAPGAPLRVS
jgi:hypothetical protein